jgi:hypothetical protein
MKAGIYDIIKAKYLINEDGVKNWQFIIFLILLAILMIANSHNYEKKIYQIADLTNQVKELRSEFVDKRSELMKIKMESTVSSEMSKKNIFPSAVPPKKIKVTTEKSFWQKLWQ